MYIKFFSIDLNPDILSACILWHQVTVKRDLVSEKCVNLLSKFYYSLSKHGQSKTRPP